MKRHALVTGGSGFLGINIILQLIEQDWRVSVLHRKSSDLTDLQELDVNLIVSDLVDKETLKIVFPEDVDVVFHVAGDTNMWQKNNDRQYQTNVVATDILSEVAILKGVGRFIHTSSISAFGFHDSVIDESTPSKALTSGVNYLKTKYLGEQLIKNKVEQGRLDAVILNPCAIIGKYDRHNWAQLFLMVNEGRLPGVPKGEGSYCHVSAVAQAHINAVENGKKGENYILAGVDHSFLDVVTKIGVMLDKPTPKRTVPELVLMALGKSSYLLSLITNKEPDMTPEKATMVSKRVVAKSDKAVRDLSYDNTVTVEYMLTDCFNWLKSKNLI
ncbi:NAD-dependent epimerase/dehydratase family protein [Psychrosphaera sp. 1_MG-2023]|uniref:NAD-dependent epimerase/dehydratase family protein n=1 Tax=Psychrosphaera sp. 1_MG-2023 TaxID=3062643 RepID=UPI0026E19FC9|nr:NAD-dependent epimerase/dehydratase family protein [Psychrosphaera sp. 1_MG-2023]MDO6720466.1 NAD-dependent epimerase/dehydratase family protein [Psychrosphaera sp. 1_MG-2023]